MEPILAAAGVAFVILLSSFRTVHQGTVGLVTMFGKFRRVLYPGLSVVIPLLERVDRRVSVQNRSSELAFQAISMDQAAVYFKAMLLFSVLDQEEETIKAVAYKFVDEQNFVQALVRSVEGAVRSFVAGKKQAEVLGLRNEIVVNVKLHLDASLKSWGYHLIDLQINDIIFDKGVMESMTRVVASQNLLAAAENEGQALLITRTRGAEAEGNAIRIAADAEREAQRARGQGIALFREEAAKGMSSAAREVESAGLDSSLIMFQMWTEAIRFVAAEGTGNVIFLDGSVEGMERTLKQLLAYQVRVGEKHELQG